MIEKCSRKHNSCCDDQGPSTQIRQESCPCTKHLSNIQPPNPHYPCGNRHAFEIVIMRLKTEKEGHHHDTVQSYQPRFLIRAMPKMKFIIAVQREKHGLRRKEHRLNLYIPIEILQGICCKRCQQQLHSKSYWKIRRYPLIEHDLLQGFHQHNLVVALATIALFRVISFERLPNLATLGSRCCFEHSTVSS